MKLAVIAANGRTGQHFVNQALAAGHSVQAGVHRQNTLAPHVGLRVMTCDATDAEQVARLIEGQDAIVSLLGHGWKTPRHVQRDAMQAIVAAAAQPDAPQRLVSLTGSAVRQTGDRISLADRLLNTGIGLIDPARLQDGRDHLEVLQASSLRWTVLRVLKLTEGPEQPYRLDLHGPAKTFVSRRTVAAALLEILEQESYVVHCPVLR